MDICNLVFIILVIFDIYDSLSSADLTLRELNILSLVLVMKNLGLIQLFFQA